MSPVKPKEKDLIIRPIRAEASTDSGVPGDASGVPSTVGASAHPDARDTFEGAVAQENRILDALAAARPRVEFQAPSSGTSATGQSSTVANLEAQVEADLEAFATSNGVTFPPPAGQVAYIDTTSDASIIDSFRQAGVEGGKMNVLVDAVRDLQNLRGHNFAFSAGPQTVIAYSSNSPPEASTILHERLHRSVDDRALGEGMEEGLVSLIENRAMNGSSYQTPLARRQNGGAPSSYDAMETVMDAVYRHSPEGRRAALEFDKRGIEATLIDMGAKPADARKFVNTQDSVEILKTPISVRDAALNSPAFAGISGDHQEALVDLPPPQGQSKDQARDAADNPANTINDALKNGRVPKKKDRR